MPFNSTRWKNWKTELIFFIPLFFVSIFRNWKIFHKSILLPRNGENLNDLQYFQIENKYQIEKLENTFISTKWKKMEQFSFFLYAVNFISIKWRSFHLYHLFPRSAKKVKWFSLFLYTYFFSFSIKLRRSSERLLLRCYFNNLKIFCFHALELY